MAWGALRVLLHVKGSCVHVKGAPISGRMMRQGLHTTCSDPHPGHAHAPGRVFLLFRHGGQAALLHCARAILLHLFHPQQQQRRHCTNPGCSRRRRCYRGGLSCCSSQCCAGRCCGGSQCGRCGRWLRGCRGCWGWEWCSWSSCGSPTCTACSAGGGGCGVTAQRLPAACDGEREMAPVICS